MYEITYKLNGENYSKESVDADGITNSEEFLVLAKGSKEVARFHKNVVIKAILINT